MNYKTVDQFSNMNAINMTTTKSNLTPGRRVVFVSANKNQNGRIGHIRRIENGKAFVEWTHDHEGQRMVGQGWITLSNLRPTTINL